MEECVYLLYSSHLFACPRPKADSVLFTFPPTYFLPPPLSHKQLTPDCTPLLSLLSLYPSPNQAETASKMVYGSTDNGRTVASDPTMRALMRAAAGPLHIAERVFHPFGGGEGALLLPSAAFPPTSRAGVSGTAPAAIVGPVECKVSQSPDC